MHSSLVPRFLLSLGCLLLACVTEPLQAQDFVVPEVSVFAEQGSSKEAIRIQINLSRSVPDCKFGFWAYGRAKFANEIPGEGIQTATFENLRTQINLAAVNLKPLKKNLPLKNKKVFFRILLACENGEVYTSPLSAYQVPRRAQRGARSKRDWMLRLKREINYAESVEGE